MRRIDIIPFRKGVLAAALTLLVAISVFSMLPVSANPRRPEYAKALRVTTDKAYYQNNGETVTITIDNICDEIVQFPNLQKARIVGPLPDETEVWPIYYSPALSYLYPNEKMVYTWDQKRRNDSSQVPDGIYRVETVSELKAEPFMYFRIGHSSTSFKALRVETLSARYILSVPVNITVRNIGDQGVYLNASLTVPGVVAINEYDGDEVWPYYNTTQKYMLAADSEKSWVWDQKHGKTGAQVSPECYRAESVTDELTIEPCTQFRILGSTYGQEPIAKALRLTTDKAIYNPSEPVVITVTNICSKVINFQNRTKIRIMKSAGDEVWPGTTQYASRNSSIVYLKPDQSSVTTWYQNDSAGNPVSPGIYKVETYSELDNETCTFIRLGLSTRFISFEALQVTTDKARYNRGESVEIDITNLGNKTVNLRCEPGYKILYGSIYYVYPQTVTWWLVPIEPNKTKTYVWDQTNGTAHAQQPDGVYRVESTSDLIFEGRPEGFAYFVIQTQSTTKFKALRLTTDLAIYTIGQAVLITVRNVGDETVSLNGVPGYAVYNMSGYQVAPWHLWVIDPLPGWQERVWTWDQKDFSGKQVPEGIYRVETISELDREPFMYFRIGSANTAGVKALRITTDKAYYVTNDTVIITVLNIGTEPVTLTDIPGVRVINESGATVWPGAVLCVTDTLTAEDPARIRLWDQKHGTTGKRVQAGIYEVQTRSVDLSPEPFIYFRRTPGDVDADGKVDLKDVFAVGKAFGSTRGSGGLYWHSPPRPSCCPHSPNCDINDDYKIDLKDYYAVCWNYGKHG